MIESIFDHIGSPILIGFFVILFILESKFRLRRRVESRFRRLVLNTFFSVPSFGLLRLVFLPSLMWLAVENEKWRFGLNYLYDLPKYVEWSIAFLLLDYGNYLWHVLNHKIPLLWRFHLVHHIDRDLDLTTAFRFHFGELVGSVFFRGAVVLLTGVSPLEVLVYEIVFEAATQFHHSNLKLPLKLEKWLNNIFVTPRMHGIHHSIVKAETDSNYSVIFSIWDRLHHTGRTGMLEKTVITGVPSYNDGTKHSVAFLWKLPFMKIRGWNSSTETKNKAK